MYVQLVTTKRAVGASHCPRDTAYKDKALQVGGFTSTKNTGGLVRKYLLTSTKVQILTLTQKHLRTSTKVLAY